MTDEILVNKQQILPALVNTAFQKLTKINPFYSNITTDNEWEDLIEQVDLVLCKFQTDKNARKSNNSDFTDSDDDIENIDKFKERELKESSSLFLTIMYNIDGPNISPSKIVNIAKFLISFILEPTEYCSKQRNHFNEEREIPITPSNYVHVRCVVMIDLLLILNTYFMHWTGLKEMLLQAQSFCRRETISM